MKTRVLTSTLLGVALTTWLAGSASAQTGSTQTTPPPPPPKPAAPAAPEPKSDVAFGYSFLREAGVDNAPANVYAYGWTAAYTQKIGSWPISAVGEITGNYRHDDNDDLWQLYAYLGGVRFGFYRHGGFSAFGQALFGAEQFAKMRPRSLFLNLCRGIVVDHDALRDHLLSGHIAGAALDVFETEPKTAGDPFVSSLQGIPNVILTPHVGGSTEEAQQDIGRFVAGKLRDFAFGGNTTMSVNLPQVQTIESVGRCRILHVHHNVPGVLATVNGVLADFGVNIEGQVLSTRGELGYVITDIASPLTTEVVDKLGSLPETVRLRVLG